MAHFRDGSPYVYTEGEEAINIGWLDAEGDFERGPSDPEFQRRLKQLCRHGVNRMRGFHRCNLCPPSPNLGRTPPTRVSGGNGEYVVGGAEIRVVGRNGVVYAAPDMVVHYVEAHKYQPAREFVEAVLATADP